jgi:hypothetical protein
LDKLALRNRGVGQKKMSGPLSGYDFELKFEADVPTKKKNRSRNITWFNPPYSANVSTSVGAKFLKIIDSCFPQTHILHKIINRNIVKVLTVACQIWQ